MIALVFILAGTAFGILAAHTFLRKDYVAVAILSVTAILQFAASYVNYK